MTLQDEAGSGWRLVQTGGMFRLEAVPDWRLSMLRAEPDRRLVVA
jgi:hypothetical protein